MAHFIDNDTKFVIRVKDIHTKSGLMTIIKTEESAFDMRVTRTLTSLQTKEIKADDFKELYHYRWNEETAFNKFKYTIGLVYFHARKRKLI